MPSCKQAGCPPLGRPTPHSARPPARPPARLTSSRGSAGCCPASGVLASESGSWSSWEKMRCTISTMAWRDASVNSSAGPECGRAGGQAGKAQPRNAASLDLHCLCYWAYLAISFSPRGALAGPAPPICRSPRPAPAAPAAHPRCRAPSPSGSARCGSRPAGRAAHTVLCALCHALTLRSCCHSELHWLAPCARSPGLPRRSVSISSKVPQAGCLVHSRMSQAIIAMTYN